MWVFHMLQPTQVLTVWDAIRALPGRESCAFNKSWRIKATYTIVLMNVGSLMVAVSKLKSRLGSAPESSGRIERCSIG
jgi:hypothetical protein